MKGSNKGGTIPQKYIKQTPHLSSLTQDYRGRGGKGWRAERVNLLKRVLKFFFFNILMRREPETNKCS